MTTGCAPLYPGQDTRWSPDRSYRYFLRRRRLSQQATVQSELCSDLPPIAFLLLNPSTADEVQDDPTVRRCRRFAAAWGYGEVIILNAFAYRATDPKVMRAVTDPIGPENDATIDEVAKALFAAGGTLVCGWGNHGAFLDRGTALRRLLAPYPAMAFPHTGAGEPGHPLYLRKDLKLETLRP